MRWESIALWYVAYLAVVSLTRSAFTRARGPLLAVLVVGWACRALATVSGHERPTPSPVLLRRLNLAVLSRGSIQVNTVPSGHAAGAVATALAVASVMPVAGAVFLGLAALIVIATALGRYHYVVDSVLGVLMALAAWSLVQA